MTGSPWPIGHSTPPEDPAKLRGPEIGERMTLWLPAVVQAAAFARRPRPFQWWLPLVVDDKVRITAARETL